jgi:hypothetical protein
MWDTWQKPGYTKNDVTRFLWDVCGYKTQRELAVAEPHLTGTFLAEKWMSVLMKTEECMLKNGFVYIDEPDGFVGGSCKFPQYQHLPSCQSLKKTREQNQ